MPNPIQKIASNLPTPTPKPKLPKVSNAAMLAQAQRSGAKLPTRLKPGALDMMYESMVAGMLTGTQTHIFNFADNTFKAISSPLETAARGVLSMGRNSTDKTYLREAAYEAFGTMVGFSSAVKYGARRLASRVPGMSSESAEATLMRMGKPKELTASNKLGLSQRAFTAENIIGTREGLMAKTLDTLGAAINLPGTALNASDIMAKMANYERLKYGKAANLVGQGKFKTTAEARKFIDNDPTTVKELIKGAEYWTYTGNPDSYIKFILSDAADNTPGLRWVVPFRRAIANLYEHTLERSPLIATSPTLMKKLVDPDPAVADTARSRLLFGTTAIASMGLLLDGKLRGVGPDVDKGQFEIVGSAPSGRINRDIWFRDFEGKEEDTILIGNERLNLRMFGPYGEFIRTIGLYQKFVANTPVPEFKNDERGEYEEYIKRFGDFVAPVVEVLYDNHWGKNLVEFIGALKEAVDRDDPSYAPLIKFTARNGVNAIPLAGSVASRNFAQEGGFGLEGIPYQVEKRTPFDELASRNRATRAKMRPLYTWDGRPMMESRMHKGHKVRNMVADSPYTKTKLDRLMVSLGVELPETKMYLDKVNTVNGVGVPARKYFDDDEWKEFNSIRAIGDPQAGIPSVREFLNSTLINTKQFQRMIQEVLDKGEGAAKASFIMKREIEIYYAAHMSMIREYYIGKTSRSDKGFGKQLLEESKKRAEAVAAEFMKRL